MFEKAIIQLDNYDLDEELLNKHYLLDNPVPKVPYKLVLIIN